MPHQQPPSFLPSFCNLSHGTTMRCFHLPWRASEDGWNRHQPQQGYLAIDLLFRKLVHLAAAVAYPWNREQVGVDANIGLRSEVSDFTELMNALRITRYSVFNHPWRRKKSWGTIPGALPEGCSWRIFLNPEVWFNTESRVGLQTMNGIMSQFKTSSAAEGVTISLLHTQAGIKHGYYHPSLLMYCCVLKRDRMSMARAGWSFFCCSSVRWRSKWATFAATKPAPVVNEGRSCSSELGTTSASSTNLHFSWQGSLTSPSRASSWNHCYSCHCDVQKVAYEPRIADCNPMRKKALRPGPGRNSRGLSLLQIKLRWERWPVAERDREREREPFHATAAAARMENGRYGQGQSWYISVCPVCLSFSLFLSFSLSLSLSLSLT